MKAFIFAAVAVLAAGTGQVLVDDADAQTAMAELVKKRQDAMKQMGEAFRPLVQIAKQQSTDYDAAIASAEIMNQNAQKIIANFPPGSGRDVVPDSRAKPEVWSKRAEFEAAAEKLVDESVKLIDAAKSKDYETFLAQFKAYGAACGGCHDGPKKSGGKFRFEAE